MTTPPLTRADLMLLPAWQHLMTDDVGNPIVWRNYYRHLAGYCDYDGASWYDDWSCQCNDRCPQCGGEVEPSHSKWIGPEGKTDRDLWEKMEDHP